MRNLFLTSFMLAAPLVAALPQPVRTNLGLVSGVEAAGGTVAAFKGIPFAAPPVGDLRWRAPRPATPWQGVRKAETFSASCIQKIVTERKPWTYEFMAHNEISEDCLYLNVWTPAKSAMDKLPVFVWIHGGGMVEGSTAVPVYDGEGLAGKGLVVVTINYRLGVLGFLSHPELTRESEQGSSGNYGLLDQVAALQWVQKNIAAFGGDPQKVTIAGQSAGSRSVHTLTASPLAKGLFHRAIAESGSGVGRSASKPLKDAELDGIKFAESKGANSIAALRAKPPRELETTTRFGPVVDGWYLPMDVEDAISAGKQNDVPMITGMVADAGSSAAVYEEPQATLAREQVLYSLYLWGINRQRTAKTPLYTYLWDHPEPGPDSARYRAFHTSEVPYVLHSLNKSDRPWTETDRKIEETMSSYWANFARTGDPNGKGLAQWAAFQPANTTTMELGDKPGPRALVEPPKPRFSQLKIEDATPEQRPLAERMIKETRVGLGGPWNTMLRSPVMATAMVDLYNYFRWKSSLNNRIVELGILITSREWNAPYEWSIHYPLAIKEGVSAETLAAVRDGKRPTTARLDEAVAYDLAIELLRTHQVSTPVFQTAKAVLGEKGVVDLNALVGTYIAFGGLLNMSEVRGQEGNGR